jgi:hypothetical protein
MNTTTKTFRISTKPRRTLDRELLLLGALVAALAPIVAFTVKVVLS